MAVRFDVANRRTSGTPVALMPEIALGRNNAAVFATAGNGTLAFAPGYLRWSRREPMQVVKISPSGKAEPLTFEPDLFFRGFELSPDGGRLAIGTWDNHKSILDLRRGTRQKFSDRSILEIYSLSWHPDGRRLASGGQIGDRTRGVSSSTRWMAAATIRSSASRCARSSPRDGCRVVGRTSHGHLWGTLRPSSAKMTVSRRSRSFDPRVRSHGPHLPGRPLAGVRHERRRADVMCTSCRSPAKASASPSHRDQVNPRAGRTTAGSCSSATARR